MARFDDCLAHVLTAEGGFVNNAADPGGATNKGITQKVYDTWRLARSLAERSVAQIEASEVWSIYQEQYWVPARCAEIPAPLDLIHFDAAVNHGVGTANRMLQTALNVGIIDGIVGQRTLAALAAANPVVTAARYCNLRVTRYIVLAMVGSQGQFLRGWLHRIGDLLKLV